VPTGASKKKIIQINKYIYNPIDLKWQLRKHIDRTEREIYFSFPFPLLSVTECQFGKVLRELGSTWYADLGPPFGVMYCIKCECVAVSVLNLLILYLFLMLKIVTKKCRKSQKYARLPGSKKQLKSSS